MKSKRQVLLALALTLLLASAHAALVTTTTIAAGNTTYDVRAIVVSNCTLTVRAA